MLQHVNTVLIGTETPASYTTADALTEGQIALFDQNRAIVKDAAGAKAASSSVFAKAKKMFTMKQVQNQLSQLFASQCLS